MCALGQAHAAKAEAHTLTPTTYVPCKVLGTREALLGILQNGMRKGGTYVSNTFWNFFKKSLSGHFVFRAH
jgi:hypothetical protein